MDDTQSINTQTAPATPAPSTAPNVDELQVRLAELERQSEGRLRDLQQERQKRQELEQRLAAPPAAPIVEEDEVSKLIRPYVAPALAEAAEAKKLMTEYYHDKAWGFLTAKTGKTRAQLQADTDFQHKMTSVVNKFGLRGNINEVTEQAYELMELEALKAKEQERTRTSNIVNSQPLAGGNPPIPTSAREYDNDSWKRLPGSEYDKLSREGSFKKVGDKIVYTPQS